MKQPDAGPILELLDGFRRSQTLFAAVALGIFEGERPEARALPRLLEALVALGLLERRGAEYVNAPVSEVYLRRASPDSLVGYIRYSSAALYRLWAHLDQAVLEGTDQWSRAYGAEAAAARSATFGGEDFCHGMHGLGLLSSPDVVAACDLSRFTFLVELGAGTGQLAAAAKRRFPRLRAAVYDFPHVLAIARAWMDPALERIAGDFCADPLPPADLFALGRILHHRDDDRCRALLRRLHAQLPPGGGVLVVERFLERDAPADAHLSTLNMLVASDGGRERSRLEYERLLDESGFADLRSGSSGAPLDWLLAIK